jgi:HEAT repeat protein
MPTWPNRPAEAYLAALADPDPRVRRQAAAALEVLAERRAVLPLRALLGDPDAGVRANAARALGRLGDGAIVPALVACLRDAAPAVREQGA